MKIGGIHTRSIWTIGQDAFGIFDQTRLPHELVKLTLRSADDAAHAIRSMQTRGAPLIGAVAANASRDVDLALAVAHQHDPRGTRGCLHGGAESFGWLDPAHASSPTNFSS